jgi:FtsP/CotA-like multicopper oxidase with cupredoxin domain
VAVRCTGNGKVTIVAGEKSDLNPVNSGRKLKEENQNKKEDEEEESDNKTTSSFLRGNNFHNEEEEGRSSADHDKNKRRNLLQSVQLTAPVNMMTINVFGDISYIEPDLKPFSVFRPCYLMDTRNLVPDQHFKLDFFLRTINGETFIDQQHYLNADQPFLTGQLIELELTGMDLHIFHMHVNHFQIIEINNAHDPIYYQPGDWHDTIHEDAGTITVRFFVDYFIGPAVIHCHILSHEDVGMMNGLLLAGELGKEYPNAHVIDPTCYSGSGGRGFAYLGGSTVTPPLTPPVTPLPPDTTPVSPPVPRHHRGHRHYSTPTTTSPING